MALFQGGAIYVNQGSMETDGPGGMINIDMFIKIYNSTFESNQAFGSVSEIESRYERFLPKELSQIFAPIAGGPHGTS